jgi:hypothetical protein
MIKTDKCCTAASNVILREWKDGKNANENTTQFCSIFNLKHYNCPEVRKLQTSVH